MSKNEMNVVKARSASNIVKTNTKVQFIPTKTNIQRMEKANYSSHIKNVNNIMTFEIGR